MPSLPMHHAADLAVASGASVLDRVGSHEGT